MAKPGSEQVDDTALAGCAAIILGVAGLTIGLLERNRFLPMLLAVLFAVVGFAGARALFRAINASRVPDPADPAAEDGPVCLRKTEATIDRRLAELHGRLERIGALKTKVGAEQDAERWAPALRTLNAAAEATGNQVERYEAQRFRIELLRWTNQLEPSREPLAALWKQSDGRALEELRADLERVGTVGRELKGRWESARLLDQPEVQECLARLDVTLDHVSKALEDCETVRQELLAQQIVAVAQEANPVKETLEAVRMTHALPDEARALDEGWANPDGFFSGFEELESEYGRLKSEDASADLQMDMADL